jgi:hypothetical protein
VFQNHIIEEYQNLVESVLDCGYSLKLCVALKNYLTLSDSVSFAVISEVKDAIVATLAL